VGVEVGIVAGAGGLGVGLDDIAGGPEMGKIAGILRNTEATTLKQKATGDGYEDEGRQEATCLSFSLRRLPATFGCHRRSLRTLRRIPAAPDGRADGLRVGLSPKGKNVYSRPRTVYKTISRGSSC